MLRHLTFGLVLLTALSACGGGSTGSSLPHVPVGPAPAAAQRITMSIRIPATSAGAASARRRPLYISVNTQSASIAINGGTPVIVNLSSSSPNCTSSPSGRTCNVTLSAPVGTDTFAEVLYGSTDGSGPALSQNTISAPIVAGTANIVNIVLDGVIATLGMSLAPASPPVGNQPTNVQMTVNFNDSSGAAIIGNAPFANPISLADSDHSGITQLPKTSLNSPSDAANLTIVYNGKPLTKAVITASAGSGISASATLTPQNPVPVTFNDYTTFGYDNQRDVYNPNTTAITPTSVPSLHLAWQTLLGGVGDYNVQSQPILATEIPGHAAVLFSGGGSGYVSAHDGLTGAKLWRVPTGQEIYTCDPAQPNELSYFGVGGTAAYDPVTQSIYVVANSNSTTNGFAQNKLMHLSGADGSTLGQVDFGAGQENNNELNFGHTSVTLGSNGIAYVGTGATCDISSWRGRIAAINVATMSLAANFFTVWNPPTQPWGGGGIWGWGGVSLDFNGNVLTGVGNADNGLSNGTIQPPFQVAPQEYSSNAESFVQLTGDLQTVLASNHPIPESIYQGQSVDLDLNGTPAIFKPLGTGCDTMAAVQGKSGSLLIYDTTRIGNGPSKQYQFAPSYFSDGFLGDPAFSQATGLLYASVASPITNPYKPGMIAINPGCGSPSVTWSASFGPDSTSTGVPRSVPAVSAGGVVFVATACDAMSGLCNGNGPYGALWELDASSGVVLNGGNPILYTNAAIRAPATIDGNWVYVIDQAGDFYGLTIDPNYKKIAAIRRSVDARRLNRSTFHSK